MSPSLRPTPLLDKVNWPRDLRLLAPEQLPQLADELRTFVIDTVAKTGGHFASGLGAVELTVALHYVFDTPNDLLVWDVGHQTYPHKVLTGRRDRLKTIRQAGGLSGFTNRAESEYDVFGAAHASTAISAALGMAIARDLRSEKREVVAIVGDGGLTGGVAMEGLNQAGYLKSRLLVILNDNDMSISPNVGAMSGYLLRIARGQIYHRVREDVAHILKKLPAGQKLAGLAEALEDGFKKALVPGHALRGAGLPVRRPDRRPQPSGPPAHAQGDEADGRARPPPRPHREGQGLPARRERPRLLARPGALPGGDGRDLEEGRAAELHGRLRRHALGAGREGPARRRRHGGDAGGHGNRPLREEVPGPRLRRGHLRAARRALRRRPRDAGLPARVRDLLDVPAARLRPDHARRLPHGPAGRLRARPGGRRRRGRPDAPRRLRPDVPARLPEHAGLRAEGRERAEAPRRDGAGLGSSHGDPLSPRGGHGRRDGPRAQAAAGGKGRGAARRQGRRRLRHRRSRRAGAGRPPSASRRRAGRRSPS